MKYIYSKAFLNSKEKMRRGVRRGCVRLRGAVVGIDDEDDATFTVTVDNKTFHFQVFFKRAGIQLYKSAI